MENLEYYYAKGGEKVGPITLEELKNLELNNDTLIWYEGLSDWAEIQNIPEIFKTLQTKKSPPPLPKKEEKVSKTEVSGELKVKTEKKPNETFEKIKPSHNALRIFLIWSGIHLFALVTSYSEIDFFSEGSPRTDKFWPFVKIFKYHDRPNMWAYGTKRPEGYWDYNGIFYRYDWSEFLVYVGGALLIFIISRLSSKKVEKPVANNLYS